MYRCASANASLDLGSIEDLLRALLLEPRGDDRAEGARVPPHPLRLHHAAAVRGGDHRAELQVVPLGGAERPDGHAASAAEEVQELALSVHGAAGHVVVERVEGCDDVGAVGARLDP
jgi:hypothetical protein